MLGDQMPADEEAGSGTADVAAGGAGNGDDGSPELLATGTGTT